MPIRWLAVVLVLILASPAMRGDEQGSKGHKPQVTPGLEDVNIEILPDGDDGFGKRLRSARV